MGVGYLGLFDRTDHTASSEWSSRQGKAITTLQIHHTAYPSDTGSRALMDPGGRTVSANGLLLQDGTLVEVVPGQYRAFTSSSSADQYCLTVETVNQSGSPTWAISEKQRIRLAKLQRDMAAAGLPTRVGFRGVGGIIGHYEVPGTYATACPGPDMHLDHIASLAASGNLAGLDPTPISKDDDMPTLFFQKFTNGGLAYVLETPWTFRLIPEAHAVHLSKAYGISAREVNEYDWDVVTQAKAADMAAYAAILDSAVDEAALAAALLPGLQAAIPEGTAAEFADAVEARLQDEFAGIGDDVLDKFHGRTES